ncbi:MAG: rhodanese-like domain-containing protein [Nitrospinota bacterium]
MPASLIADWIIEGRNDFMIIDIRSEKEYENGHLPGAIHSSIEELSEPETLDGLPDYKKLVFYEEDNGFDGSKLYPVFARGLHVLIIRYGYKGWVEKVLEPSGSHEALEAARMDAVAKYFKGESILGTPRPLTDIPAQEFVQKPKLKKRKKKYVNEGC